MESLIKLLLIHGAASGRAQALGRTEGMTKWIVDPETERILGCGIVGPNAGELIAEAALAIEMGCVVRDIAETVHAHPTLGETMMNAAEVFYGTATEFTSPRRNLLSNPSAKQVQQTREQGKPWLAVVTTAEDPECFNIWPRDTAPCNFISKILTRLRKDGIPESRPIECPNNG